MTPGLPPGSLECPACHRTTMRDVCSCGQAVRPGARPTATVTPGPSVPVVETPRAKPRMPKLNDTEKRWWRDIPATHFPAHKVIPHGLTLPLTDGGTYTVDFYLLTLATTGIIIEIKGGYVGPGWEQGIERYRRARYEWAGFVKFEMWEWKDKKWEVER